MKITTILATMLLMLFAFACAEPEATDTDAAMDQTEMTSDDATEMADDMMEPDSMDADDMMESEMQAADMDDESAHEDQMEEHAEEPSNID